MKRRDLMTMTICAAAAGAVLGAPGASAAERQTHRITHGFFARVKARPGMGDALVDLLFEAPAFEQDDCLVFLVGRSRSDPDMITVTEGWKSQEAHERFTQTEVGKAYITRFAPLVVESTYGDEIPVGGKALLG